MFCYGIKKKILKKHCLPWHLMKRKLRIYSQKQSKKTYKMPNSANHFQSFQTSDKQKFVRKS